MREFTPGELAHADGRDGAPAYVACEGLVHDVTQSFHWRSGRHHVRHRAGTDLTAAMQQAPHGADLLTRVPIVGRLGGSGADPVRR